MSIDSVIADLEARMLFETQHLDPGSHIDRFRQPSRLVVNQHSRPLTLRAGFVAKDFVVGFPDPPIEAGKEVGSTLWLAPLANVISVRRAHSLQMPLFLHTESNEQEARPVSLRKYLASWVGEQVVVTLVYPEPDHRFKTRYLDATIPSCILRVDRNSLVLANSDGEVLIPFHSIESLVATAGSVPVWKTGT
jgi:hypothetical protein